MSTEIIFSGLIRLADIKKSEKLKVGRKQHLYGDSNLDIPTFKISHKDFPKEAIYVIYNKLSDKDKIIQNVPCYKDKCDELLFCEAESWSASYHIVYELNREFGLKFAYNVDPRDENPKFEKPMSLEEYEKWEKEKPIIGKFLPVENVPLIGNFNSNDEKYKSESGGPLDELFS